MKLTAGVREQAAPRRIVSAACLLVLVPAGIAWRMAPLHLPRFAWKYGGSMLWAAAVYWAFACLWPLLCIKKLMLRAGAFSVAVELFKLPRIARIDVFRDTLPGKLLLGRYFSFGAMAAYVLAIGITGALDARWRPGRNARPGRAVTAKRR